MEDTFPIYREALEKFDKCRSMDETMDVPAIGFTLATDPTDDADEMVMHLRKHVEQLPGFLTSFIEKSAGYFGEQGLHFDWQKIAGVAYTSDTIQSFKSALRQVTDFVELPFREAAFGIVKFERTHGGFNEVLMTLVDSAKLVHTAEVYDAIDMYVGHKYDFNLVVIPVTKVPGSNTGICIKIRARLSSVVRGYNTEGEYVGEIDFGPDWEMTYQRNLKA